MEKWLKWSVGFFVLGLVLLMGTAYMATPPKEKAISLWLPMNSTIVSNTIVEKFSIVEEGGYGFKKQGNMICFFTDKERVRVPMNVFKQVVKNSSLKTSVVVVQEKTAKFKAFYVTEVLGKIYISEKTIYSVQGAYKVKKATLSGEDVVIYLERDIGGFYWFEGGIMSFWLFLIAIGFVDKENFLGLTITMHISMIVFLWLFLGLLLYFPR